jgi:catechol 2,3-dioxygenase-like lactoylglutathione lyase family enzyme
MPTQLRFDVTFVYPDRAEGITIPTVLSFGDRIVNTFAKADPGVECCVFSREIGEKLGLDIERGIHQPMGSLTGTLDTFGHEVTIQTFDLTFQSIIYFAKYPGLPRNLLGRIGWLRQAEDIPYGSGPYSLEDRKINRRGGGRGVYFRDPNGHVLELLTAG